MATNKNTCEPNFENCDLSLFGAYIAGVNANHSWGQTGASISVSLIERPVCEGDTETFEFCPPKLGSPVCLDLSCASTETDPYDSASDPYDSAYKGWKFLGLLDSWDINEDATQGKRIEVRLVDPVQIVDGYQIILGGYDGQTFGVRNLCNLYGFLLSANGPQILARTLDDCGCEIDFDDDPYDPYDTTGPPCDEDGNVTFIDNPYMQRLIYPSEFLDRDGRLRRNNDPSLSSNKFIDYLYDKVGLKWHMHDKDVEKDFPTLFESEVESYFQDGYIDPLAPPFVTTDLAAYNKELQKQDQVTREIFRRKFWDGSEENGGGVPAILILQALRGLFTGGFGREKNWRDFGLDDYPSERGWDNIEEIREWRCFPERDGVNGQKVPAQVPVWEFWQPPKWRDHFYLLDLTALEEILINDQDFGLSYRIQGDKVSLLEFVDKVCGDLGYDWQFVLEVNEDINSTNVCATYNTNCKEYNCLDDDKFPCYYYDPYPNSDFDPYDSDPYNFEGYSGSGLTIKLRVFQVDQEKSGMSRALVVEGNAYTDCVNVRGADDSVDDFADDVIHGLLFVPEEKGLTKCPNTLAGELKLAQEKTTSAGTQIKAIQVGVEQSKEPKNSFVIGDKVTTLHQVIFRETDDPTTATIWPYWGDTIADHNCIAGYGSDDGITNHDLINEMTITRPIAGRGVGDFHHFDVDCSGWDVFTGVLIGDEGDPYIDPYDSDPYESLDTYRITVMELKAALAGQDEWLAFYSFAAGLAGSKDPIDQEIRDIFKDHDIVQRKLGFANGFHLDMLNTMIDEAEKVSIKKKYPQILKQGGPPQEEGPDETHAPVYRMPDDTASEAWKLFKRGLQSMRVLNLKDAPNDKEEDGERTQAFNHVIATLNPRKKVSKAIDVKLELTLKARRERLFKEVEKIAQEYYGKKFIVSLPFVCDYLPGEHGGGPGLHSQDESDPYEDSKFDHYFDVKTSWETTDSAWCEAESILGLPNLPHNQIGFETEKEGSGKKNDGLMLFKENDGKIGCFVRYNCAEVLDLSNLNREDYILQSEGDGNATGPVWIRATVEKIIKSVDDTIDPYAAQTCQACDDPYDPDIEPAKDRLKYLYNADSDDEFSHDDADSEVNAQSLYAKEPFVLRGSHHTQVSGLDPYDSDPYDSDVKISCFPTYSHNRIKYYDKNHGMGYLENIKRKIPWKSGAGKEPSADRLLSLPTTFGFGYFAVISVPGTLIAKQDQKLQSNGYYINLMEALLYIQDRNADEDGMKNVLSPEQRDDLRKIITEFSQIDHLLKIEGPDFFVPAAAAIPLVSNIHSYGPYYSSRQLHIYPFWPLSPRGSFTEFIDSGFFEHLGGKTDVIHNQSLNPWTNGSIERMHQAGNAEAESARSRLFVSEQGSLTAVGLPEADLGDGVLKLVHNITSTGQKDGGPIITDIRVQNSAEQGVTTTYGFKTHFKRFGVIEKTRVAQLQRISAHRNERLKEIHTLMRGGNISRGAFGRIRSSNREDLHHIYGGTALKKSDNPSGTKDFIYSDARWADESEVFEADLSFNHPVIGDYFNEALPQLRMDDETVYTSKAGFSTEGIFRPFDTRDNGYSLSAFKNMEDATWDGSESDSKKIATDDPKSFNMFFSQEQVPPVDNEYNMPITVNTLNPFKSEADANDALFGFKHMNDSTSRYHDIEFVVRGDAFPTHMSVRAEYNKFLVDREDGPDEGNPEGAIQHDQSYRGISLRGPLLITGWGFDIHNDPVPAALPNDGHEQSEGTNCKRFLHDWLRKPHTWKTGPVDLRWDEDRGVWGFPQMKLIQVSLCECLDRKHDSSALGRVVGEEQQNDKNCNPVQPKTVNCTTSEDVCEFESGQSNEEQTVTVYNRTGKVVTPATKVMAYFDTVHRKYYVITAPDPLFLATVDNVNVDGEKIKLIQPSMTDGQATIYEALDDAEFPEACNGNLVQIKNSLRQPICAGQKVLVRLTETVAESKGGNCNLKGEVLQAEFEALCVVTSVDCYENSNGEPTLEICDRLIYLQTAWTIEDCGDDEEEHRRDTKGWNPDGDRANENEPVNIPTEGADAEFPKATDDVDGDNKYDPDMILPKREDHWECAKKEEESEFNDPY